MKKLFTLIAFAAITASASAQVNVKNLECSNINIYMTTDTVKYYKDPDSGEVTEYPWSGSEVAEGMITAGYPVSGQSTTDHNYVYAFRNDYTDPETGFNVKKGYYRGMFIDGNMNMYGNAGDVNTSHGYTNLKKVVLYFVGLPQTWTTNPAISHSDYPTGRVYAKWLDSETGAQISNTAYREIHTSMDKKSVADGGQASFATDGSGEFAYFLPKFMGYTPHISADGTSIDPRHVTFDQPFKVTYTLDNSIDETALDTKSCFQEADGGEKGEWLDASADDKTEETIEYYFGKLEECNPYRLDPDKLGTDCSTGRNTNSETWATKLVWSSNQPIAFGVKKRMVLIGMSLISGSPALPQQHFNASDGQFAEVQEGPGSAYGSNADNEFFPTTTEKIDAGDAFSDRPFAFTNWSCPKLDTPTPTPTGKKGDANGDGSVDVADITAIASYILGEVPTGFNTDNADVNGDTVIDVADITGTASIILGN